VGINRYPTARTKDPLKPSPLIDVTRQFHKRDSVTKSRAHSDSARQGRSIEHRKAQKKGKKSKNPSHQPPKGKAQAKKPGTKPANSPTPTSDQSPSRKVEQTDTQMPPFRTPKGGNRILGLEDRFPEWKSSISCCPSGLGECWELASCQGQECCNVLHRIHKKGFRPMRL
jgi:hypothetical protein